MKTAIGLEQIFEKIDTNAPAYGALVNFFRVTQTGYNWIVKNRLKTVIRTLLNAAIDQTKEETAIFINTYWAFDTGRTADQGTGYIRKRMFTDLSQAFGLFIGADEEYFQYVLTMADRMRAKGKAVNWTNPKTRVIEDDILGKTAAYAKERLQINIKEFLASLQLGWMVGRGAITKQKIEIANKLLTPYRGTYKPIQFM